MISPHANFDEVLAHFESALRNGQIHLVARAMAELEWKTLPRPWRLPLAKICRRSGLITVGLRVLHPAIRGPEDLPPSSEEAAEYALLLQRSGVVPEALEILDTLNFQQVPESALYRAFCHFSLWDYEAAAEALNDYLSTDLKESARLTGRIHLAAAQVHSGQLPAARENLRELRGYSPDSARTSFDILNLSAQLHYAAGEINEAKAYLDRAMSLARPAAGIDPLLINKWLAAIQARETGTAAPLKAFREEAVRREDWESVREADLLTLQIVFNRPDFDYLYFGTPFEAYRTRARMWLGQAPLSSEYLLGDPRAMASLNLLTGEIRGHLSVSQGSKVHQLFDVLFRDFYRPFTVGSLFSSLFEGENYDVEHSPDRVHQVIRRARRFLEASHLPLTITSRNGTLRAEVTGPLSILIPLERPLPDANAIQVQSLRGHFGEEPFSARQAREALKMTPAEFKRLAAWAVAEGLLEKLGASSATVYALARRRSA